MGSLEEILAGYGGLQAGQEAFYKDLHCHPELSHQEHRTAERVAGKLQEYGCTVQTGIGGTGVVGVLANGAGPTVLLRGCPTPTGHSGTPTRRPTAPRSRPGACRI
jgi:metal-dependent amidase/aminoacylase/carboxypeptidase family protein